jgi:uncharacterized membrane protein
MNFKLNWKIRSQNPMFYIQIILSFFIPVLGYLGLNWSEMTTWGSLFDMICAAFSNPYCLSIAAVSVFNAVVDSTSPGIGDSNHVLCLKCLFDDCEEHERKDEEKNNKDV